VFQGTASGPVAIAAGPAIDPGPRPAIETVNGVTIHRGDARETAAPVQVASAGPARPQGNARMRRVEQGVRVHSGTPGTPVQEADAGGAETPVAVTR
jgi:hypothetical protein